MPFVPRTVESIVQSLVSKVTTQSELTDTEESSVLYAIMSTIAEEINFVEQRIKTVRDSYDLSLASATDLDDRVAELAGKSMIRLSASAAGGPAMELNISETATADGAYTLPAGTMFASSSNSSITYALTSSVLFAQGVTKYPQAGDLPASIICTVPGLIGNASAGDITVISNDSGGNLTTVTNINSVTGGRGAETDAQLRSRAKNWLSSLARAQRLALIEKSISHQTTSDSDNKSVFKNVNIYEDPYAPGVVELVVDDGSGDPTGGTDATVYIDYGSVPLNMSPIINHRYPLTKEVQTVYKYIAAAAFDPTTHSTEASLDDPAIWNAIELASFDNEENAWISQYERGVLLLGPTVLVADGVQNNQLKGGDVWALKFGGDDPTTPNVFLDPIASLQRAIEGSADLAQDFPGYRAAGIRVIVTPPTAYYLSFNATIIIETGLEASDLQTAIKEQIVSYCQQLGPGETLFISQLISDVIENIEGLIAINFFQDAVASGVVSDTASPNPRTVLRTLTSNILVG